MFLAVRRALAAARERFGFRLAQYSVQGNHIHLIAEANDQCALTRGVQGLAIRVARAINKLRGRRGRVLGDRYHARQLKSPLEVRRALLYVLNNQRKHVAERGLTLAPWHFDRCSSAREFDGWQESLLLQLAREGPCPKRADGPTPSVAAPRSFLLRVGWRRWGLLAVDELPGRLKRAHGSARLNQA